MYPEVLREDLKRVASEFETLDLGGSSILVTGATGLIASLLVKAAAAYNETAQKQIEVTALARNPEKVEAMYDRELPGVQFVFQNIEEPVPAELCCDYIVHTANPTASGYFLAHPVEVMDSIYLGTRSLLEHARAKAVKGMVYLSSMEAFGVVRQDDRVAEEQLGYVDLRNIRSCYQEGKRSAELLCKCYAAEYGVPVVSARLAQTFGAGVPAGDNRVFAQFARSAMNGEDIILHTKGQSVGNYCYTTDVLRAVLLLLKKGTPGETYTVVNEETTRTIAEMAGLVADRFSDGRSKVVFDIPEGKNFGYAPDTKMRLSGAKIRSLGWEPEYALSDMYERLIRSMKMQ